MNRKDVEDLLIKEGFNVDKTGRSGNYSDNVVFVLSRSYDREAGNGGLRLEVIITAAIGHSNELDDLVVRVSELLFVEDVVWIENAVPISGRNDNKTADIAQLSVATGYRLF